MRAVGRACRLFCLGALLVCALPAVALGAVSGALKPIAAPGGCVQDTTAVPTIGCLTADGLNGLGQAAIYGPNVYVPGRTSDSLVVFSRNATTGRLSFLECWAKSTALPDTSHCHTDAIHPAAPVTNGLDEAIAVAVSPDGKDVYVAGHASKTVVGFRRNASTGVLTPNECLAETGSVVVGCAPLGRGLFSPVALAFPPAGAFLYVASDNTSNQPGEVATLPRDASTGALLQPTGTEKDWCISVASDADCNIHTPLLAGPVRDLVVSPDANQVYAGVYSPANAVVAFDRVTSPSSPIRGSLQLRVTGPAAGTCVSNSGSSGACIALPAMQDASQLAFGPGGTRLYVTGRGSYAVIALDRNSVGGLSPHPNGCLAINISPGCRVGAAISEPFDVVATPNGANVYSSSIAGGSVPGAAIVAFGGTAGTNALNELPSPFGCVQGPSGSLGSACVAAPTLATPSLGGIESLVLSADGRFLYATAGAGGGRRLITLAVDRPPVCKAVGASTKFNTPVTVALSCSDPDGDATPIAVTSYPAHGNLGALQPGNRITYSPFNGTTGHDTFYYRAIAAGVPSDAVAVSIDIGPAPKPKPRRITAQVSLFVNSHNSRFTKFVISPVPHGAAVLVRCKNKGCPFKKKSVKVKSGKANALKLFKHKKLRAGMLIDVYITAKGWIGEFKRVKVGINTKVTQTRCLPVGSMKPRKTC